MSANNSNSKQGNKADQSNNVKESENSLVNNVLKYDKLGGWYDEKDIYYNVNGIVSIPPKEELLSPSENEAQSIYEINKKPKYAGSEQDADDEKELDATLEYSVNEEMKQLEEKKNYYFEKKSKNFQKRKKMDKLEEIISNYDKNQEIKFIMDKIPSNVKENELKEFILKTVQEKINLINLVCLTTPSHKRHFNSWKFCVDKDSAIRCLILEGKNFYDQTINLCIEPIDLIHSSDDENDLFSSDQMQNSDFQYKKDGKFKSGGEDFENTEKQKTEPKNVIFRNITHHKPKEENKHTE